MIDPAFQAAGWWVVEGSRIRLGIDLDMGFGGLATAQTNTAQTNTDQNIQKTPSPSLKDTLTPLPPKPNGLQKIYE